MSGPDFWQTRMGQLLIEGTLPSIARSLERIAAVLEKPAPVKYSRGSIKPRLDKIGEHLDKIKVILDKQDLCRGDCIEELDAIEAMGHIRSELKAALLEYESTVADLKNNLRILADRTMASEKLVNEMLEKGGK